MLLRSCTEGHPVDPDQVARALAVGQYPNAWCVRGMCEVSHYRLPARGHWLIKNQGPFVSPTVAPNYLEVPFEKAPSVVDVIKRELCGQFSEVGFGSVTTIYVGTCNLVP